MGIGSTSWRRFSFLVLAAIVWTAGCASKKPATVMQTRPLEPGTGACKTAIESDGSTGLVRYVREGKKTREMWDRDGDGVVEMELHKKFDDEGRLVTVERMAADGTVAERVERTYEADRLVTEETDRWTAEGKPGPDGTVDWRRTLTWTDGRLVREEIDELDGEGLPGVDGTPEFVVDWDGEGLQHISGTRTHTDGMVVATYALDWDGDHVAASAIDYGADGKVDQTIEYTWRGERVTRVVSSGPNGDVVITHEYCR